MKNKSHDSGSFFNKLINIIAILFIINKNAEEDKCINKLKNRKRQTNNKQANKVTKQKYM